MMLIYGIILIAFLITVIYLIRSICVKYNQEYILNKVSAKISDGYLIFTANGKITNYNESFLNAFHLSKKDVSEKNIRKIFHVKTFSLENINQILEACKKIRNSSEVIQFEMRQENRIYQVEVKSIVNNDIFLRYVILFKDVTNTYEIIEELQNSQDIMTNREKFATLGQLISGIMHSLKSPIFALSGEVEGVNQFINEYEESVGDDTVTVEDHYAIAQDIKNVLAKMKEQVQNISDSITAVRSQVITLNNEEENSSFTVNELMKYVDLLMKNTLKEHLITLQFTVKISKDYEINGNFNVLVQVINNLIMNSIESYRGKKNQTIDVVIEKRKDQLAISVIDTGCGISKRIQNKIFKEIITKKDGKKIGIGLFMAYSNIKARI